MVVKETADRRNNFYSVTLSSEFDSNELDFISVYGEPKIDVGGTITYGEEQTFVKDSNLIFIRSQFPVTFGLNVNTDANAVAKVNAWKDLMISNLQTALNTLLANTVPNFPSTTTHALYYVD